MKVAIVHDYLFQFGGAEKCVENWLNIYPKADIYTTFSEPEKFKSSKKILQSFEDKRVYNSLAQWLFILPFFKNFQKHLYFLYPFLMSLVTVKNYDLVIISSTFCAKNVRIVNCSKIKFYCHAPTRFLYNLVDPEAQKSIPKVLRVLMKPVNYFLRIFDQKAVKNLIQKQAEFLANSKYIQKQIKLIYKTDSKIVYPPVDIKHFLSILPNPNLKEPFYFYCSRISFHKRLDLAVLACLNLGKKLIIAGESAIADDMKYLQKIVTDYEQKFSKKKGLITFLGRVDDDTKDIYLSTCKAVIFPAKEDFGIFPIESLASGVPVISFQAGGALEYIKDGVNGVFFPKQTVESLSKAILELEKMSFNTQKIKDSALDFSSEKFEREFYLK